MQRVRWRCTEDEIIYRRQTHWDMINKSQISNEALQIRRIKSLNQYRSQMMKTHNMRNCPEHIRKRQKHMTTPERKTNQVQVQDTELRSAGTTVAQAKCGETWMTLRTRKNYDPKILTRVGLWNFNHVHTRTIACMTRERCEKCCVLYTPRRLKENRCCLRAELLENIAIVVSSTAIYLCHSCDHQSQMLRNVRIWFSCLLFQSDKLVNCEWGICLVLHSSRLWSLNIDAKSKIVLTPFTLFPCSCVWEINWTVHSSKSLGLPSKTFKFLYLSR